MIYHLCWPSDLHIDSSIIALDAKASDTTATDPKGEGEKNADWARRMELYLGKQTYGTRSWGRIQRNAFHWTGGDVHKAMKVSRFFQSDDFLYSKHHESVEIIFMRHFDMLV